MTTSTDLTTTSDTIQVADRIKRGVLSRDVVDTLKDQIIRGGHKVTDTEFANVLIQAQERGLSPLNGQMWAIVRREKVDGQWKQVLQPQVGIAGLRLIAERTGRYGGVIRTEWCGEDEQWRTVWISNDPPVAARVTALRDGVEVTGIAYYRESVQTTASGEPNAMWQKRHTSQLAKCAEAQLLRQAFPEELAGVHWTQEDDAGPSRVTAEVQRALGGGGDIAATRGRELAAAGERVGLDRQAVVGLLEQRGLGTPNTRTLGDTTSAGERLYQAMLQCITSYEPPADEDVVDGEYEDDGLPEDRSDPPSSSGDTDPDNHDPRPVPDGQDDLFGEDPS